jgi:hypothetical protein
METPRRGPESELSHKQRDSNVALPKCPCQHNHLLYRAQTLQPEAVRGYVDVLSFELLWQLLSPHLWGRAPRAIGNE